MAGVEYPNEDSPGVRTKVHEDPESSVARYPESPRIENQKVASGASTAPNVTTDINGNEKSAMGGSSKRTNNARRGRRHGPRNGRNSGSKAQGLRSRSTQQKKMLIQKPDGVSTSPEIPNAIKRSVPGSRVGVDSVEPSGQQEAKPVNGVCDEIDATVGFYAEDESAPGLSADVLDAVVKIYATHCDPNYSLPWQMRRQTQSTSSGFVISGRRILTNAHSVEHYTVVKVKKRGSDHKFIAKVLAIGNECDIALLTIADEDFWNGLKPLRFGNLPELQASVIVVGYPIGGENISVTAGVVSRVEIQEYTHGASQLLGIQIDAAINSGSSGGPAMNHKNEVVGIAFQSLNTGDTENIGYLVAESVVAHFLKDYEDNGRYTGFCHCGFQWQRMENISLRRSMKMQDDENGILVRRVDKTSEAPKVLREGDIVTHIDGVAVSNAGTVPYRSGERISFHYIITTKFTGDKVRLRIIRDGEKKEVEYALGEITRSHLVPVHDQRRQPEYLTVAGLVFVAISEPYLCAEYGDKWDLKAPVKLLDKWMHGYKETPDEQVVVLSQVLNAEINIGYEYVTNTTVHRFNGVKVRNLAHLARLVEDCADEYLRFDLDHDEVVVVSRKEANECSAAILETHCIPAPYSIGNLPSSATQDSGNATNGKSKGAGGRNRKSSPTKISAGAANANNSPQPNGEAHQASGAHKKAPKRSSRKFRRRSVVGKGTYNSDSAQEEKKPGVTVESQANGANSTAGATGSV